MLPLFVVALMLLPTLAGAQAAVSDQARKEGQVVVFSTVTLGAFNELNKAIKEKYPVLNVQHIRLGPAQQLARIAQKKRAGHYLAEVVYNILLHLIYLKETGALGRYPSPETRFMKKETVDSDGIWVGGDIDVLGTGVNTRMISRNQMPTSYDGFLAG